jgi:rubredoxin
LCLGVADDGRRVSLFTCDDDARIHWSVVPEGSPGQTTPPPTGSFRCNICHHVYDPALDGGGLRFEDLPESWVCPVCGQPKLAFSKVGADQPAVV